MPLQDTDDRTAVTVALTCCPVAGIAVVVRFWCKAILKAGFRTDDWFMLLSLTTYWTATVVELWGIFTTPNLSAKEATIRSLKGIYVILILVHLAALAFMLSICFFYRQIFTSPGYRKASLALIFTIGAFFIAQELSWVFSCTPVEYFWNRWEEGSCMNERTLSLSFGVLQTVLLVCIFALPIRKVFDINIPLRTKLEVSGIFLLGGISIITDIVMVYYIYRPQSQAELARQSIFWLHIHIATAITSACLPVYKPLRNSIGRGFARLRKLSRSTVSKDSMQSTNKSDAMAARSASNKHLRMSDVSARMKLASFSHRDPRGEESDDGEAKDLIVPRGDGAEHYVEVRPVEQDVTALPPMRIGVTNQFEVV